MRMYVGAILCSASVLAAFPAAADDLIIISKVTSPAGNTVSTVSMSQTKLRRSDGKRDTIMDFASGQITTIDHAKKEYWEMSPSDMAAANQKMADAMKRNPQAAKMMEGMTEGMAAAITVTKGPGTKKIAGYDCVLFLVTMSDAMKMEVWTTTALRSPMSQAQLMDAQQAFRGASPMARTTEPAANEFKKITGVALAETTTVSTMGVNMKTSSEATEVRQGPIPASAFDVPTGYRKIESPMNRRMKEQKD